MSHEQAPNDKEKRNEEAQGQSESAALKPKSTIIVDAVELKTVEMRLQGIKEATHRSRFVFLVMTILASAIFITVWNGSFSWEKGLADKARKAASQQSDKTQGQQSEKEDIVIKPVISEWVRGLGISIALLGTRVSVNDLSLIGSASLIVVMTWYFYSQRRENRAIVSLLQDCVKGYKQEQISKDVCYMVFAGIVHSLVFIDLGKGDEPLDGLVSKETEQGVDEDKTFLIRGVVRALVYLAPATIIWIVLTDIWTLYFHSPLRDPNLSLWATLDISETIRVFIFDAVAISSAIYTGYLCRKSTKFSRATANTLIAYQGFLKPEPSPENKATSS